MQFKGGTRVSKVFNGFVVVTILACYYFLPLAAPFILLYLVAGLAWLFRLKNRVPYYVELSVPHLTP